MEGKEENGGKNKVKSQEKTRNPARWWQHFCKKEKKSPSSKFVEDQHKLSPSTDAIHLQDEKANSEGEGQVDCREPMDVEYLVKNNLETFQVDISGGMIPQDD